MVKLLVLGGAVEAVEAEEEEVSECCEGGCEVGKRGRDGACANGSCEEEGRTAGGRDGVSAASLAKNSSVRSRYERCIGVCF